MAQSMKDVPFSPDPINFNFTGVVSRDSIRTVFTYAALHYLDFFAAGIKSAYLQVPTSEK